jgi:hypothetical protein
LRAAGTASGPGCFSEERVVSFYGPDFSQTCQLGLFELFRTFQALEFCLSFFFTNTTTVTQTHCTKLFVQLNNIFISAACTLWRGVIAQQYAQTPKGGHDVHDNTSISGQVIITN